MTDVIGALRVHISADSADYVKGLTTAEKKAAATSGSIQKSMGGIQKSMGGVRLAMAGLVAGLSVSALTAVAKKALDYASSLKDVSQQLNVTTRDLQVLRFAASQNGIAQAELDKGLSNLATTLGKVAAGAKAPTAALNAIGIQAKDLAGLDTGGAFRKIADGLQKVSDRAQRSAVSYALFGEAGKKLDVLLAGGAAKIDELARAAERMGIVLSDKQIQDADKTAQKLSDLKQVLEAKIAGTVADNADSILSLANALSNLASSVVQFLAANPAKAAAIIGAIGGGVVGGPIGAAAGAIGAAGVASMNTPEGLRDTLNFKLKSRRNYYIQNGGTEAELASGKLNPAVVAKIQGKAGFKELNDDIASLRGSLAGGSIAAPTADDPTGAGGIGQFLAPKPRSGRRGKTAEQLERERLRREEQARRIDERFEADVNRAQQDILSARIQLSDDADERAALERERVNVANEQARAEITQDKDLTEARRAELLAYNDRLHLLDIDIINKRENVRIEQEQANIVMDRLRLEQEILSGQADLAETQAERRKIELKILDAKYAELRQSLRQVTKENGASRDQVSAAQDLLTALPQKQALEAASIRRGTMGPLESYLNSLPNTAAKANEAMEAVAAGGIQSMVDGLADAAVGARSLADVFKNVARQIIADLIRIQIQKAIVGGLNSVLSAFSGGISPGTVSSLSGDVSAMIAANPGTFASGGYTGGGPTGQVAGLVHGQEYVLNAAATRRLGIPNLDALNSGRSLSPRLIPENGGGGRVVVELNNDMLNARIVEGSVEVVRASAPGIVAGAKAATMRDLSRPRL